MINKTQALSRLREAREQIWLNPLRDLSPEGLNSLPLSLQNLQEVSARFDRFAPLIARLFPDTVRDSGRIASPLQPVPALEHALFPGRQQPLLLKRDDSLPAVGSVKARGGVYEVLKHAEALALEAGLLTSPEDDPCKLLSPKAKKLFAGRKIQVGSTGNLGLSIGSTAAFLGFQAIVHMSADAKGWKKQLLRERGATVVEYPGDYGKAVARGREESVADPCSYFVDDENSRDLFLGYAAVGQEVKKQLEALGLTPSVSCPLTVYLPCGVGGAPAGISFGLAHAYGEALRIVIAEPVQAPCMTLSLITQSRGRLSVQDYELTGQTEADGLAVGRASALASAVLEKLAYACCTLEDSRLLPALNRLHRAEGVFIEPSACASIAAATALGEGFPSVDGIHLLWATGGSLVPADIRATYYKK
ncbi:MAG: D-serine ammonia-lyase [Oscillospiraceae bacterium]|nr:D-serine ammonia-lyase [Oscillospiraceae bacterium]